MKTLTIENAMEKQNNRKIDLPVGTTTLKWCCYNVANRFDIVTTSRECRFTIMCRHRYEFDERQRK
jgi:hypothetical protein